MKVQQSFCLSRSLKSLSIVLVVVDCFFTGALAQADNIYVDLSRPGSADNSGTIDKLDSNGNGTQFASGLNFPAEMAFDGSGNLYVASWLRGTIVKVNSSGTSSAFASGLVSPNYLGLACDGAGNLFAALSGNTPGTGSIEKFSPNGNGSAFASGLGFPSALAFDKGGNLFVALDVGNPSIIMEYKSGGGSSQFATVDGQKVTSLAVDNSGNVYAAMTAGTGNGNPPYYPAIEEFDSTGNGSILPSSGFSSAGLGGLALDSSGNLYVVDKGNNAIDKFTSSGSESVFATGLDNPQYIAIPVPEPATWAMVALGMGVVLGSRRLRRRSS